MEDNFFHFSKFYFCFIWSLLQGRFLLKKMQVMNAQRLRILPVAVMSINMYWREVMFGRTIRLKCWSCYFFPYPWLNPGLFESLFSGLNPRFSFFCNSACSSCLICSTGLFITDCTHGLSTEDAATGWWQPTSQEYIPASSYRPFPFWHAIGLPTSTYRNVILKAGSFAPRHAMPRYITMLQFNASTHSI